MNDLTFDGLVYATLPTRPLYKQPTLAEATIVLRSRKRLEDHFPWPETLVANAEYALTEAAQYLAALIRRRRTTDLRNRNKDHDPLAELSQCGYMIASGLLRTGVHPDTLELLALAQPEQSHMHAYGALVNGLACTIKAAYPPDQSEDNATKQLLYSWAYWHFLVRWHCDTTPTSLILATAKRIEEKHIKP